MAYIKLISGAAGRQKQTDFSLRVQSGERHTGNQAMFLSATVFPTSQILKNKKGLKFKSIPSTLNILPVSTECGVRREKKKRLVKIFFFRTQAHLMKTVAI